MTRPALPLVFALTLTLTVPPQAATAQDGAADPHVKARMAAMKATAADMKALTQMARGETPFEAGVAGARLARIAGRSAEIPALFETRANDPASEARAAIWENWADFSAKADALVVAASGTADQPEALTATLQEIAAACKACHGSYKD